MQSLMADEWNIDQLDLDAYLRRIDHTADTAPTAETLARLHRAHLAAIPFENQRAARSLRPVTQPG